MKTTEDTKNSLITVVDMDKLRRVKKPENYRQFAELARKTMYGYTNVYKYNSDMVDFLNRKKVPYRIEEKRDQENNQLYTILEYE